MCLNFLFFINMGSKNLIIIIFIMKFIYNIYLIFRGLLKVKILRYKDLLILILIFILKNDVSNNNY
jgi:hypothetical protein